MKHYPDREQQRNAQSTANAADDLAVAILQDRLEDASKGRQLQQQPLSLRDVERLRQQGALN